MSVWFDVTLQMPLYCFVLFEHYTSLGLRFFLGALVLLPLSRSLIMICPYLFGFVIFSLSFLKHADLPLFYLEESVVHSCKKSSFPTL
jgi:hypothetical protein